MSKNEYEIGKDRPAQRRRGGPMGGGPMRGAMGGEKAQDFRGAWGKLFHAMRRYRVAIIIAVIFAVGGSIMTLLGPNKLSDITGSVMAGFQGAGQPGFTGVIDMDHVVRVCVTLVIIYAAGAIMIFIQGWITATVVQRTAKGLRMSISEKINRLPLRYFDSTTIGNVTSRVTNDIDTMQQSMNQSMSMLVTSVTMFLGSIVMMFDTDAIMALTAIGATVIGFAVMMIIVKKTQKYFARNQRYLGAINGHIEETYAGHNIVKAYNAERKATETFDGINAKLYESNWKSQFLSGIMMPLMNFIGNFGYVAVCIVGAALTMKRGVEFFPTIVAFMIYIRLFTQPLSQIAQSATLLQSAAAAAERVFEFVEEPEMADESGFTFGLDPGRVHGGVRFDHVKFGYSPGKTIIRDFSADIQAGQKVAIVGPTGAGKTTMVNLLMKFYETDSGEISIDGVPISRLRRENVHDLFCMVLQDTWLFEGTIRENIVYSKQGVTDEEVVNACKAVGMHHYIRTLPQGYNTVLNDNANLSAGQRQLITIARAMIENAPLLILDEATSSVDTRTEVQVQRAMDQLTVGRTSFVIAHRLSTIKNADVILVMRDGDIVEKGSHEDLLAQGGFYASLYNSQFEDAG